MPACIVHAEAQGVEQDNKFYTSELPEVREARLAEISDADAKVERCKGAVAATAGRRGAAAARHALADAVFDAVAAKAPPNFPVQLCYSKNSTEILGHSLEGFNVLAPGDESSVCDTFNMYNEGFRTPTLMELDKCETLYARQCTACCTATPLTSTWNARITARWCGSPWTRSVSAPHASA